MSRSYVHAALLFTASLIVGLPALGGEARISVPSGKSLVMDTPDGWSTSNQAGPVPSLSIKPKDGSFQLLVSPLVAPDGRVAPSAPESIRALVERGASNAQLQAVEKSLPLQPLQSSTLQGFYFSATDRAPRPGEFKNMTQGAFTVGSLPVAFTVLSNGKASVALEPALRILKAARHE